MMILNRYYRILVLIILCLVGCRSKNGNTIPLKVSLKDYTIGTLESNCTMIVLLKAYTVKGSEQQNGVANLYVCRKQNENRPFFVFEIGKKAPEDIDDPSMENEGFCIYQDDVQFQPPSNIKIYVPKGFSMPKGSEYIFASLRRGLD